MSKADRAEAAQGLDTLGNAIALDLAEFETLGGDPAKFVAWLVAKIGSASPNAQRAFRRLGIDGHLINGFIGKSFTQADT